MQSPTLLINQECQPPTIHHTALPEAKGATEKMFSPEAESRILQRIQDLEEQDMDMPTLPDLPSLSDVDITFPDSPAENRYHATRSPQSAVLAVSPSPTARTQSVSPTLTVGSRTTESTSSSQKTMMGAPLNPFTSTPAPSSTLHRSEGFTSNTNSTSNSTKTILGQRSEEPLIGTQGTEEVEHLPSFDADGSSIGRVDSGDEDRDEMVIISESDSDKDRQGSSHLPASAKSYNNAPLRISPEDEKMNPSGDVRSDGPLSTEEGDEDKSSSSNSTDSDGVDSAVPFAPTPPSRSHREYEVPISTGSDGSAPSSERARRLSTASAQAHISMRRKSFRKSAARAEDFGERNAGTPFRTVTNIMAYSSPELSEQYPSPEIGRHASPQPSPHSLIHFSDQSSQQQSSNSTTPVHTSSHYVSLSQGFSTPRLVEQTDAERRKEHVLMTLQKSANKSRMARGTPHPLQRHYSASQSPEDVVRDNDSFILSDETSSNDLTSHHHKGNTSLPSGGVGVGEKSARFNSTKLNSYLHTLNSHLTEENQELVKTLGSTTKDLARAVKDKKKLEDKIQEMSMQNGTGVLSLHEIREGDDKEESSRVEALQMQLEELVKSHQGINRLTTQVEDEATSVKEKREDSHQMALLQARLEQKDIEIERLREQIVNVKDSEFNGASTSEEAASSLSSQLQREIFSLKDELEKVKMELDVNAKEGDSARKQWETTESDLANELNEVKKHCNNLTDKIEEREADLDNARNELEVQEQQFAEKMSSLEKDLCRVMEEQEVALNKARADLEEKRLHDEKYQREQAQKLSKAVEYNEQLKMQLNAVQSNVNADELQAAVAKLSKSIQLKDGVITDMGEKVLGLEKQVDELLAESASSKNQLGELTKNLAQMEEALDESEQQLFKYEDDTEKLRMLLASEKNNSAALSAQITRLSLHKTKARSPLINEVTVVADPTIATLEEELELAHEEISQLKQQLIRNEEATANMRTKEIEVETLNSHKAELEDRVNSLRQQVSIQLTPKKTPEQSFLFKSILGVPTPKTPGHFMSNLSTWSPGMTGDETITPLLSQIQELELVVERLQAKLADANGNIDQKLNQLEAAGFGTIDLMTQLASARARIAHLESEFEALLGDRGSLRRVQRRLQRLCCPSCSQTFDANRMIQLKIHKSSISLEDSQSAGVHDSLRLALAGVNSKITQIRPESGTDEDNHTLTKLQENVNQAKSGIEDLEGQLKAERVRVHDLAKELSSTSRVKVDLETRLAAAETCLREANREIGNAQTGPGASDRLKKEKGNLIGERADLLQQLTSINEHVARVDRELGSRGISQNRTQGQLDDQIMAIRTLRESLHTREAEKRLLQDERGDILRGVASLQADLQRVRQETASLGLDIAAVRRERDEIANGQQGKGEDMAHLQDELTKARRAIGVFEQTVADHICPSNVNFVEETRARHAQEAKGLLVMIRYLKASVTREHTFRSDMIHQKAYLTSMVAEKQSTIDEVLAQLGLSSFRSPLQSKLRLKSVATAIIAIRRMGNLSRQWRTASAPKERLRSQAYPETRGRRFPY